MISHVVGIDPSLAATGVALDHGRLATIKTDPKKHGDGGRLVILRRQLRDMLTRGGLPALVVIEDLPTHAKSAGLTGRAQGVVRMTLSELEISYLAIPPATLKVFATGKGNAKKELMREAWLQFSGEDVADDNQVDAAWLRQVGLYLLGDEPENPRLGELLDARDFDALKEANKAWAKQLSSVDRYREIRET